MIRKPETIDDVINIHLSCHEKSSDSQKSTYHGASSTKKNKSESRYYLTCKISMRNLQCNTGGILRNLFELYKLRNV